MKCLSIKAIVAVVAFVIGVTVVSIRGYLIDSPNLESKLQITMPGINKVASSPIHDSAHQTNSPIGKIDFRNFTYKGFGVKNRIRVKNGTYEINHVVGSIQFLVTELKSVHILE